MVKAKEVSKHGYLSESSASKAFKGQMEAVRGYKAQLDELKNIQGKLGKKVVYGQKMDSMKWLKKQLFNAPKELKLK